MSTEINAALLEERIAAAFVDGAKSGDIADLISETEAASVASGGAAERSRMRALDPTLSAADVAAARRDMEDAAFRCDRMGEAVRRLGGRLREVKRQEEQARRLAAYDAALAERDALATELAEAYPTMAKQLADLAGRIATNDAVIERINGALPDGAKWMAGAEMIARELRGFNDGTANVPRITQQMRLPAFKYLGQEPYTWPRHRT